MQNIIIVTLSHNTLHPYTLRTLTALYANSRYKKLGATLLFCTSVFIIFPRFFYVDLSQGESKIDNGWMWALNFFFTHNDKYQWGKDVVYTYGPLGFLSTRSIPHGYWFAQFIFDLYIAAQYIHVFILLIKTNKPVKNIVLFSAVLLIGMWEPNVLLCINMILVLTIIESEKKYYRLSYIITLNSIMLFYIKLNTLPIILICTAALWIILLHQKKHRLLCYNIILFLAFHFLLNYDLNISFAHYISSAFDTVLYYSASMYAFNPAYRSVFYVAILLVWTAFLFEVYISIFRLLPSKQFIKLLLIVATGLMILLLYKEGFTRLDRAHYNQFLCFFPLVIYCLYTLLPVYKKLLSVFILVSIFITLGFSGIVVIKKYPDNIPLLSASMPLKTYISQLAGLIAEKPVANTSGFSGKSYDYYSNQCINQMYNSNTNWHSRPAFQAIAAVSPYLDSMNALFYTGKNAPDTIFYDNLTTDNRNSLWDDPQCKWSLFKNYSYSRTDQFGQLVLTKRYIPLERITQPLVDTFIKTNQVLQLPVVTNGMIALNANVTNTLFGSIRSIVFHPPHVSIIVQYTDSAQAMPDTFRYIVPLFNGRDLLVGYGLQKQRSTSHPNSNESAKTLFTNFNNTHSNVKSITFSTDMPSGIQSDIHIRLKTILLNNPSH